MSIATLGCFELSLWVIYVSHQTHSAPVLLANPREDDAYPLFLPCHTYILWANPEVKAPPEPPRREQLVLWLAVGTARWCDMHLAMTHVSQPNHVHSHLSLLPQIIPYSCQSSHILSAQHNQTVIPHFHHGSYMQGSMALHQHIVGMNLPPGNFCTEPNTLVAPSKCQCAVTQVRWVFQATWWWLH